MAKGRKSKLVDLQGGLPPGLSEALAAVDSQLLALIERRVELLSQVQPKLAEPASGERSAAGRPAGGLLGGTEVQPPSEQAGEQSSEVASAATDDDQRLEGLPAPATRWPLMQADWHDLDRRLSASLPATANDVRRWQVDWLRHGISLSHSLAGARQRIAFLGPQYSYSYLAAVAHFGLSGEILPVASVAAVFEEILRQQADFGVVPLENSTDGRIVDTLSCFARWPVQICGEILLPIHHCLLARCDRSQIREVYSKPQAISQCRGWLSQHVPEARLCEVASTSVAAAMAAEQPHGAAIAAWQAGVHHGLQVVAANIEDAADNVTRFVILGHHQPPRSGHDKTALMFQISHRSGALAETMQIFRRFRLNMTWIESFPLAGRPSEYLFFVELEGHRDQRRVRAAIERLSEDALRLEVLGSYPRASVIGA